MQQREVSHSHIVKVDFQGEPGEISTFTLTPVCNNVVIYNWVSICHINTSSKFSRKQTYSQDTKYEPENEADKQNVQNGRYGTYESINYHLKEAKQKKNIIDVRDSTSSWSSQDESNVWGWISWSSVFTFQPRTPTPRQALLSAPYIMGPFCCHRITWEVSFDDGVTDLWDTYPRIEEKPEPISAVTEALLGEDYILDFSPSLKF